MAPSARSAYGSFLVLHLIRMWLDCPVEETDDRGRKTRMTEARDTRRGIPQGSPISPLLANIYMRRFVLGWKMFGLERTLGTRLVTYADDLVILCRRGKGEEALQRLREIMGKLKLTVNEEKTRICKVPGGEFDFLGYTFGRMFSARTGEARIGYRPSKKSIERVVEKVHALTDRAGTWQETTTLVASKAATRDVRLTSTPAVRRAQGAVIRRQPGGTGQFDPLPPFRIGPANGREAPRKRSFCWGDEGGRREGEESNPPGVKSASGACHFTRLRSSGLQANVGLPFEQIDSVTVEPALTIMALGLGNRVTVA